VLDWSVCWQCVVHVSAGEMTQQEQRPAEYETMESQTYYQLDTDTHSRVSRHTDRQTHTAGSVDTQTDRQHVSRHTDRQTHTTCQQTNRQTDTHSRVSRHTDRQTHTAGSVDTQIDRHDMSADTQTDRHNMSADTQTDRHTQQGQ